MANVTFLQMHIYPWNLNTGKIITRLSLGSDNDEIERFVFPISCIFASLDCICKQAPGSPLVAHLYSIITLVFTNMSSITHLEGCCPAKVHLKDISLSSFLSILIRCFKIHVDSTGVPQDVLSFRLCLCAIRAINSFSAICLQTEAPASTGPQRVQPVEVTANDGPLDTADGEDIWGSMDDDVFALIGLDGVEASTRECLQENSNKTMWVLLTSALEQSKVSSLFAHAIFISIMITQWILFYVPKLCSLPKGSQ